MKLITHTAPSRFITGLIIFMDISQTMIKWINRVTICTILSSLNFRCVSSYFATPNDVFLKPATIYFDNGTEKTGEITIQFANAANSKRFVTLFHREINQSENINVDSIKKNKNKKRKSAESEKSKN